MNEEIKAEYLVRLMGRSLAIRYVNAKISHFDSDEFISVRTETKEYWQFVESLLSKFSNPFKN
jgi:hypothetical protein